MYFSKIKLQIPVQITVSDSFKCFFCDSETVELLSKILFDSNIYLLQLFKIYITYHMELITIYLQVTTKAYFNSDFV